MSRAPSSSRRRAWREILLYGLALGALTAVLRFVEFRFLVVDPSVELFALAIAVLFAGLGLWLGRSLVDRRRALPPPPPSSPGEPFTADAARQAELGITGRELEVLGLIAQGLSNREIAGRLFVSENTVKTHAGRLFDKLGARRRTEAVRLGKANRLLP